MDDKKFKNLPLYISTAFMVFVVWILIYSTMPAPDSLLQGKVLDKYTKRPLKSVNIATKSKKVKTDDKGQFELRTDQKERKLKVSKDGYETKVIVFKRKALKSRELEFLLRPTKLSGSIIDTMSNEPLKGAIIRSDGQEVVSDDNGWYELTNVGKKTKIQVLGPTESYEAVAEEVNGLTRKDFKLSPTGEEAVRRIANLTLTRQYEKLYALVHPDTKAIISKERFVYFNQRLDTEREKIGVTLTDIEIANLRLLPEWYSSITQNKYQSVTEAQIRMIVTNRGNLMRVAGKLHLLKVEGVWNYFMTSGDVQFAQTI